MPIRKKESEISSVSMGAVFKAASKLEASIKEEEKANKSTN